jgi:hypothetical protein
MAKVLDLEGRYEPDERVPIHENAVRLLVQRISTHDAGLAELVKNSCDAYAEADAPQESKVIAILLRNADPSSPALVGCLDFVGMTTDKIETRFKTWGDPQAASGGQSVRRKGGHGHGGKAYMVNMFREYAVLITCSGGFGNRYGYREGSILPGYFPDRTRGRRFPVEAKEKLLGQNLAGFGLSVKDLPQEARAALAAGAGFTLVKGVDPRDVPSGRIRVGTLVDDLRGHPQMIEALQEAMVFIFVDGRPFEKAWPLQLEAIEPMEEAREPREFPLPVAIRHPASGEMVQTVEDSARGSLVLRTSKKSMMWTHRGRHRIYIHARGEYIGSWDVRDLAGKGFADQIYGDLHLGALFPYKTSDRVEPANSVLTQAVREWVRETIERYCQEFVKLERLKASQKDRNEWQRISEKMNEWKNKFLENVRAGVGKGRGFGGGDRPHRHLPKGDVGSVRVSLSHEYAGIGVAIQPTIEFRDAAGERVRMVPYRWHSGDWNVATVDEDLFRVVTHTPGRTEIWAETLEGKPVASNRVQLTVLDIKEVRMTEEQVEVAAGHFRPLGATVEDRAGTRYEGVYLNWIADNDQIVRVGPAGVVWAIAKGTAEVTAGDDRALATPGTRINVVEGLSSGKRKGFGFPRVLLSGIDTDPFDPETAPEQFLTRRHPPVHQRVFPDDVSAQIWWINMAAPLASRYWAEAIRQARTSDRAKQWRVYYLERFIEAMVKIRLFIDAKIEGQTTWENLKERWDDVMVEMQEAMASELEQFLESGIVPGAEE